MPSVNVVNGKQIVVETLDPLQRVARFLTKPFLQMWQHQDLIQAILRRELRSRFQGSAGGWIWAVFAPLVAIAVYTMAFTTNLQLPLAEGVGSKRVAYALFIFSGIVIFNFFSEMAFRSPMLLHEYAHYIKQTIFPSDMLAVISTLRATAYTGDLGRRHAALPAGRDGQPAVDGVADPAGLPAAHGVPGRHGVVPVRGRRVHARRRLSDDQHRAAVHVRHAGLLSPQLAVVAVRHR